MTIREDVYSANGWNLFSTFLFIESMGLLFASPIVLAATWGITRDMLIGYVIAFVVTVPFCLILAWSQNRYTRRKNGFLELDGDVVHYYDTGSETPRYSAQLDDCSRFWGSRTWATIPNSSEMTQIAVGPKVILLEFPESCRISEQRYSGSVTCAEQPVIFAVGQTEKTRKQWLEAFENSSVKYNHDRTWPISPITGGFIAVWTVFIIGFCFLFLPYASRKITNFLLAWNCAHDIVEAVGFSFFIPGIFLVFYWMMFFPMLWVGFGTGINRLIISTARILFIIVGPSLFFVVPVYFGGQHSLQWKISFSVSSGVLMLLTICGYWVLIRPLQIRNESPL